MSENRDLSGKEWASGHVDANGIRIHYHRTGGDKPPVVLAHGITDNGLCWTRLARALQVDFDVIMYDARGHGSSDAPEEGYSITDHVGDLVGLAQVLKLEKPILMGHSMGGGIVARTAAEYPELPRAVILEDPVHMFEPPSYTVEEWQARAAEIHAEIANRKTMTREQLIELCRTELHPNWSEEELGPWAESKLQVSPHIAQIYGAMPSLQESFPRIRCPVLILKADADKETKREEQKVANLLASGTLIHVEGAGHNVRRDNFPATLQALTDFLNGL
jgi:pimeloyl-ACP methyl ester carboxylesterase